VGPPAPECARESASKLGAFLQYYAHLPTVILKKKNMMPQKRYNVFGNIHKALRRMLFDIQTKIQQTDFSAPEAAEIIGSLKQILEYYDEHAVHEDKFLISRIVMHEPKLAESLEKDHVIDHKLSQDLAKLVHEFETSPETREETGSKIFYAMNEFIAFNLYHMNKEETELLAVLWKHYSDEQIINMEQEILAYIDPGILMEESRWMMRSINNREISEWLHGVRIAAPDDLYRIFIKMAETELTHDRFKQLQLN
jgi:hypothetical protein